MALGRSMLQQVSPGETGARRRGSAQSRYNPEGLQPMGKSKPEQGQGEKFTATLNPRVWFKGTRVDGKPSNPTTETARTSGGQALQEAVPVQH